MSIQTTVQSLDDLPLVMSVEDLMPVLGIGRNSVYDLVRSGRIDCIRIGRKIRITKSAVIRFIEQKEPVA